MTQTARQKSVAKGRYIMKIARRLFESQGAMVEVARNHVRFFPKKSGPGLFPLSMRHDFFGVWDAIVVFKPGNGRRVGAQRIFIQVTDVGNMAHRKEKILSSGFPVSAHDLLLGYRGRSKFRVLRGPEFNSAEEMKAPKATA